jgi:hypothetical protein
VTSTLALPSLATGGQATGTELGAGLVDSAGGGPGDWPGGGDDVPALAGSLEGFWAVGDPSSPQPATNTARATATRDARRRRPVFLL